MKKWFSLWVRPREAFRAILYKNPKKNIFWIALIWGILTGLFFFLTKDEAQQALPLTGNWAISASLVIGAAYGLVYFYLMSWVYQFTGKWIRGKGTYTQVKCAVGWSLYPQCVALAFGLLATLTLDFLGPITLLFSALQIVGAIWGIVLLINFLAEAHQFSGWRALGNWALAMLIFVILFVVILAIFPGLQPIFISS